VAYLVYDADCGFCTKSARWLARRGDVEIKPWQSVDDLEAVGLHLDMVNNAAYWVDEGSAPEAGHLAIGRALVQSGGWRRQLGRFTLSPVVAPAARRVYSWVARNRYRMPGSSDSCRIPPK
jgi:predicted DCC family thiol-disulfide oxidoreductase YuxK